MDSLNKILVCLDPLTEKQPALEKAIYLAKAYNASVEVLLVVYNRSLVTNHFFNADDLETAKSGFINSQKRWVETYLTDLENANIPYDYDVVWHKPLYEAIIHKAESCCPDLVIKSTHKHPTINKILFTPNDWQLLKYCPVPLILAKGETGEEYKNILAAIDPTNAHGKPASLNPLILNSALAISSQLKANPQVAYCYEPLSNQMWSDIGMGMGVGMGPADFSMGEENYREYVNEMKLKQRVCFDEAISNFKFNEEQTHLEEGYAELKLPELVEQLSIDLLVIGTSYHSAFIGSTVEKILDQVNCDIFSVQAEK